MKGHEFVLEIDFKEFPKGHPTPQLTALEQLKKFPNPRYNPNSVLNRNYNWTGVKYLGRDFPDEQQAIKNTSEIQEELVKNWNYYFHLGNAKALAFAPVEDTLINHQSRFIAMANAHPEWPISITTFWPQVAPKHIGEEAKRAYIRSQELPDKYYLKGFKSSGRFKTYSYGANPKYIKKDGATQKFYFESLLKKLERPITIINENGETRPQAPIANSILEADKCVNKDFKKSKLKDWSTYQAHKKLEFRKTYSQEFLGLFGEDQPKFTWYNIDGNKKWQFEWNISKTIASSFNGNYYSTTDYYPRWPNNWKKGKGSWKGWSWLERSRKLEIENGDRLFSPFVAAGWDVDPEKNIRPSQWLGLLKNLSVIGAEFFYTGFFNLDRKAVATPANYIWQVAMPSYAQAIASRYQDILKNGDIVKDKNGNPIFDLLPSEPKILVTARKHLEKKIYVIAAAILPFSNDMDEVEDKKMIEIQLAENKIRLQARRQGSVYLLDLENEDPIFYQLDVWHEAGHPQWWSIDFSFEAELFDKSKDILIKTENPPVNSSNEKDFLTFVVPKGTEANLNYLFTNDFDKSDLTLNLRGTGTVSVSVDDAHIGNIEVDDLKNWTSKKIDTGFQKGKHLLSFELSKGIQFDKFYFSNSDSSSQIETINNKE